MSLTGIWQRNMKDPDGKSEIPIKKGVQGKVRHSGNITFCLTDCQKNFFAFVFRCQGKGTETGMSAVFNSPNVKKVFSHSFNAKNAKVSQSAQRKNSGFPF